ncbi:hypothetical protein LTR62_008269 [Meristemomyces frigidus]|uniref:Glycosyltransferase family 32 protein n=1 Tax=Meristemomyces frigidus TaxID=1508187 RepID=A0AAN7YLX8_9PEZI|nr:hypothetical protein LTR62_008269 [Meristemomyces frigidus]
MYVEGGIWADIDVEAIRPIDHFIPKRHSESDIGMVVGVETDEPGLKNHPVLGAKATSFCQWTFMCKPRLPVMMRLIDNILIWLTRLAVEQGRSISDLELNFDEVLNGTGPSAFTTAILAEMTAVTGRKTTWDDFHDLEESKVLGGVLVLTSEAFAAGTGHSDSGNHHGKGALVKHHFHASSWTTNHPRFKHPIYGEVEKCNWDVECVKLWDANTAFFASLPKEDQRKMIGLKDREETAAALDAEFAAAMPVVPKSGPLPAAMPPAEAPKNDLRAIDNGMPAAAPAGQADAIAPPPAMNLPPMDSSPLMADAPPAIAGIAPAMSNQESLVAAAPPQQEPAAVEEAGGIAPGLAPGLPEGLEDLMMPAVVPESAGGELVGGMG